MKICGIICEYNPFHEGHLKHLEFSKDTSDAVICVMSGNYVQRGESACIEKHLRAIHAIKAGADIVIELPTVFSVAAADDFAFGAMKYLTALKCSVISFGSECGNIDELADISKSAEETAALSIKAALKSGASYPKAFALAVNSSLFDTPNNLLAVKYISCGEKLGFTGEYLTLKRKGAHGCDVLNDNASAGTIRKRLNEEVTRDEDFYKALSACMPEYVIRDLTDNFLAEKRYEDFVNAFTATLDKCYIKSLYGVSEGIENRIASACGARNYRELVSKIKTKRYTMLRIKRILTAAVLGITKDLVINARLMTPYINVLAINRNRKDLLAHISDCAVTKDTSKYDEIQALVSSVDKKGDRLYNTLTNSCYRHEYLTEV